MVFTSHLSNRPIHVAVVSLWLASAGAIALAGLQPEQPPMVKAPPAQQTAGVEQPAFGVQCQARTCQFWLTHPALMLRPDIQAEWDFGDGWTSTQRAPMHTYSGYGSYQPSLRIVGPADAVISDSRDLVLGVPAQLPVTDEGVIFQSQQAGRLGARVAGLGDFSGNAFDDIAIGTDGAGQSGTVHVVFGGEAPASDLDALDGFDGFRIIDGEVDLASDRFPAALGSGDFNQDGASDLLIGDPGEFFEGEPDPASMGLVWIFHGAEPGSYPPEFELDEPDGDLTRVIINDTDEGDGFGFSLATVGNLDGSGNDTLIVGAPYADGVSPNGIPANAGSVYAIRNLDPDSPLIQLSSVDFTDLVQITNDAQGARFGWSVSSIGDFNGSGLDDFIVGAPFHEDVETGQQVGRARVVFGDPNFFPIDGPLAGVGTGTLDILPDPFEGNTASQLGTSVAGLGDVNGNGLADIGVGATLGPAEANFTGTVYVIFGDEAPGASITVSDLDGNNGFRITGLTDLDFAGGQSVHVSRAGDINGNGLDDVLVSAPGFPEDFDTAEGDEAGRAWVIFGSDAGFPAEIDVQDLDGTNGATILPAGAGTRLGADIAAVGGFAGADQPDQVLIGAPGSTDDPGAAWLMFSGTVATPPLINDGQGIEPITMVSGETLEVDFEISDAVDDPADLVVELVEEVPGPVSVEVLGEGALRTLEIVSEPGQAGTALFGLTVTNSAGLSAFEDIEISVDAPPLVNDGQGIEPISLVSGETLLLDFEVSDAVDDPEALAVQIFEEIPGPVTVDVLGEGAIRTLEIVAAADQAGAALHILEVTNTAGISTFEEVDITVEEPPVIPVPTITPIANQSVTAGDVLTVDFQVSDPEFAPENLLTFAFSGNQALVPDASLNIQGTGANRTLVVATSEGPTGTVPITVEVVNPLEESDSTTFSLAIVEPAQPLINDGEPLPDQTVTAGDAATVDFLVADPAGPAEELIVSVTSSNQELIPDDAITVEGTGEERSLTFQTVPGVFGESLITVEVTNSLGQTATSSFLVTVTLVPTTLELSGEQLLLAGFGDGLIRFTTMNTGAVAATGVVFEASIDEPFQPIAVFAGVEGCSQEDGAFNCPLDQAPAWQCSVFDDSVSCLLESLAAGQAATVVIRTEGAGQAPVPAAVEAANAPLIPFELELIND